MAGTATKYAVVADKYSFAEYGIRADRAVQINIFVIRPMVVTLPIGDFNDTGKMIPGTIEHADETFTGLGERDAIGEINMLIADTLSKGIRIPETPELKKYLSNFPDIREILPAVCKLTMKRFSHNAQLSLELSNDPEDATYLILYVRQEQYDDKIMEKIDDIRSTYGEKLIGKKGLLLVTTDFSHPK